ncbi:MAG: HlyD family efflux transporter periplasmic adaptor subunit [Planctomycetaceae bacterium]|nr:HlyD family efflux transporter periplasmic adaptor subunit [Planctomycetaceae bacterium]
MKLDDPLQDQLRNLRTAGDRLIDASPPLERFFRDLLAAAIDGRRLLAGIVWFVDQEGRLKPICDFGLQNVSPDGKLTVGPREQQQLNTALRDGQVAVFNGQQAAESGQKPRVIGPLQADGRTVGGVELFFDAEQLPGGHRDLLHFVEEWCGYAVRYLDRQRLASQQPADPTGFWEQFERFTLELQRTLDAREVAAIAVNDGRLMVGCDRISLIVKEGKRIKVRGISGQDDVEHRANLVSSMRSVARQVMRVGEPLVYRGDIQDIPPQLEKPLATFLQEGRARMTLFIPLLPPEAFPHKEEKDPGAVKSRKRPKPIGCLVVEQFSESRPLPVLRQRADLVADHVAAALYNAQRHQTIFLLWLWVALGRLFGWFRGRNLMISAAVLAAVAAAGAALTLVPWDYRVEGLGKTMPVKQQEVFAPWDGDVIEILVESGQRVKAGDPLIRLESDDLREAHVKATTELSGKKELLRTLDKQIDTAQRNEDAARYQIEWTRTNAELPGIEEHVRVLEDRMAALTVRSPIDGVVATFQIRQKLQDRPVRRGEVLLEVMDDTGEWRLELEVPEYRMGHLLKALAASENGTLPVEYVLATAVETSYHAEVAEIATRTGESEGEGTIVEVFADIDPNTLPSRRIGAEVEAKINCGKRSLGYVLFGDVVEFVQRHFWL